MAPKRSIKVTGTVVKTTKKVVKESLEVSLDIGAAGSEQHPKVTDGVPVVVVLTSAKKTDPKGGSERVPEAGKDGMKAADAQNREKKSGRDGAKRRRKRRGSNVGVTNGGYQRYLFRVLKQVHPGKGASSRAMLVLEGMMVDMFERIVEEAARLSQYTGKATLSSREIQDAVRLVLPGELGKHAIAEGVKAVTTYMNAVK